MKPMFNAAQLDRSLMDAVIHNQNNLRGQALKGLAIKASIGTFLGGMGVSVLWNTLTESKKAIASLFDDADPYDKNPTPGIDEGTKISEPEIFGKILEAGGVEKALARQWTDYYKYGFDSMLTGYDLQMNGDLLGISTPFVESKIRSGFRTLNQHPNVFYGMMDGVVKTFSPDLAYRTLKGVIEANQGYEMNNAWQPQFDRPYDSGKLIQDLIGGNRLEDTQFYDKSNKIGGLNLTTEANQSKFISAVLNASELDVNGKKPDDQAITRLLKDNKALWDKASVVRDVIQMAWDNPQRQQQRQADLDKVDYLIADDENKMREFAAIINKYNARSNTPVSYGGEAVEKIKNLVKQYYYSQSVMEAMQTIDPNGQLRVSLKYPKGIDPTDGYTYALSKFLKPTKTKKK
jgi:hypothetical protein